MLPASCSLLCFPSSLPFLSPSLSFSLSLCFSLEKKNKNTRQVWQEKRQMARMTGETFWKEEVKIKRCEEQDESSKRAHTHTLIHTVYFLLFYMLCVRDINYNYVDVYTHIHTHTPSAHALYNKSLWCFGLEADRHAGECDSLYHHDDGDVIERLCFMSDPCAVGLPVLCRFTLLYCMLCNYYTQSTEADLNM